MSKSKSANITKCLEQIPSRFELILVAARRARMLQNYDADLAKARNDIRSQSPIVAATRKAKDAKGGSKMEDHLQQLQLSPPEEFLSDIDETDKPTIIALREIENKFIDKDYLDRQQTYSQISRDRHSIQEAEYLASKADIEIDEDLKTEYEGLTTNDLDSSESETTEDKDNIINF